MWEKCHLSICWQHILCTILLAMVFINSLKAEENEASTKRESDFFTSSNQLMKAKLEALEEELYEQEKALAKGDLALRKEENLEHKVFDSQAYVTISIKNEANPRKYELAWTKIYVDGKIFARGGKRNNGLPRKSEMFFGPVREGCHEIAIEARFIRITNEVYNIFKINREVMVKRTETFIAKNGYHLSIALEGFDAPTLFVKPLETPDFRFNNSVRPNFLPGAPLVSFNEIAQEGRVIVNYITGDATHHRLVKKSISIDGLPILVNAQHDSIKDTSILFDHPLSEGRHTMKVTLVFGQVTWIGGGPLYNFRLTFDREFYVLAGQTTVMNVVGLPRDGFRSQEGESRYARVSSQIVSTKEEDFFPKDSCKVRATKEKAVLESKKNEGSLEVIPIRPKNDQPSSASESFKTIRR